MYFCTLCIAESISSVGESLFRTKSKVMEEESVNNMGQPTADMGKLPTTEHDKNQTSVTAGPIDHETTQPPTSPTTQQPTTPEILHNPIKVHLKEPCLEQMGEKLFNKNYILQYMNYAGTKNNITYFSTIYKYKPEVEDYSVLCSLSYRRTQEVIDTAATKNEMVYLLVPYVINEVEQYCVGLRRRETGESKLLHTIGLNPAEADLLYNTYKRFNYQLAGERYVVVNDEVKVTSVYRYSQPGQQVLRHRNLSYRTLMNRIVAGQRRGYHITDISSYTLKGVTHYSLLLTTNLSELKYTWLLRSRQRTKGMLKTYTKRGFYPLAIVSTDLGYSEPYYLVSLTSTIV